jgi:hypothetical protein
VRTKRECPGILEQPSRVIRRRRAKNGLFLNGALTAGKGHGYEANLAYMAMAPACIIAGGGALSIDALLVR